MSKSLIIILLIFLCGCSKHHEIDDFLSQSLGYSINESYDILSESHTSFPLDRFGLYNANYKLQISDKDHQRLLLVAKDEWKPQPESTDSVEVWESIVMHDKYGLISIARFSSNSRVIRVHVSEY